MDNVSGQRGRAAMEFIDQYFAALRELLFRDDDEAGTVAGDHGNQVFVILHQGDGVLSNSLCKVSGPLLFEIVADGIEIHEAGANQADLALSGKDFRRAQVDSL